MSEQDTLIIEPRTSITSFDGIPWAIQKAVCGAIAAILYGKDKDLKDSFYKSATNRKNKEVLVELASQVYSYLNGTISEFADTKDYAFRVWTQASINRKNGTIVGQPVFDVEIYKYVGRVAAQSVELKDYSVDVTFVGKRDDSFVTPFMFKALKRAKSGTKYMKLDMYTDHRTAPKNVREKVVGTFPTLIIGDEAHAVKSKLNQETGAITVYIEDGSESFDIGEEKDVVLFLSRKSGIKPEILGLETAFQPVDTEIHEISKRIMESANVSETDFLKNLNLDEAFESLESKMKSKRAEPTDDLQNKMEEILHEIEDKKNLYQKMKTEYEVGQEEIKNLNQQFQKKMITFEVFDTSRVRTITNQKTLEQQLVHLQTEVKSSLAKRIRGLFHEVKQKGPDVEK